MREAVLREHERLDDLMRSGRKIIQDTREFCFSLDAVLLAHFPHYRSRQRVLELGTGTGVIPLLIADEVAHVEAVEISPVMAELAARNVYMNELEARISVRQGDYREIRTLYPAESFDTVLANPPYRPVAHGQVNKMSGVARARHEFTARLVDVVRAARYALKFGGHGGMDFLMDLRLCYCLQNGLALDQNVYDAAAWSSLCELTEKSARHRGATQDIPDFTRGAWKTTPPLGIVDVDLGKMGLDGGSVKKDGAQLSV